MVAEIADIFNFNTIIALGALAIAGIAVLVKLLDKGLSLREHEEFKNATKVELATLRQRQEVRLEISEFIRWGGEFRAQVNRDFDRLEEDLRLIDAAKPSAGELQEAMKAVDARVTHLEEMIRDVKRNGRV